MKIRTSHVLAAVGAVVAYGAYRFATDPWCWGTDKNPIGKGELVRFAVDMSSPFMVGRVVDVRAGFCGPSAWIVDGPTGRYETSIVSRIV